MPTTHSEEIVDDEAEENMPRWPRSNPGHAQTSAMHSPSAGTDRRRPAPHRTGQSSREVERRAGKLSAGPGLTPTQWLAQWCRLDEET